MPNVNQVTVAGHLLRAPEMKVLGSGMKVTECAIAVNNPSKNKKTGEWESNPAFIDIVIFGDPAERFAQNLGKGSGVVLFARLAMDKWDDKQTGKQRTKLKLVVDKYVPAMKEEGTRQTGKMDKTDRFKSGFVEPSALGYQGGPGDEAPSGEEIPF